MRMYLSFTPTSMPTHPGTQRHICCCDSLMIELTCVKTYVCPNQHPNQLLNNTLLLLLPLTRGRAGPRR
jgi:hypothetical protein